MRRIIIRSLLALVAVVAFAGALAWPWPAPEIDWRSSVDKALANRDCKTAEVITDAAASAGSREAYQLGQSYLEGACAGEHFGRSANTDYLAFVSLFRPTSQTTDEIYGLNNNDLGLVRHRYVTGLLFLCAAPYNGLRQIDYAGLSKFVPDDDGPLIALHRLRREMCIGLLHSAVRNLVDAEDAPANEVANLVSRHPPLSRTTEANFLYGRLWLEKGFVPKRLSGDRASAAQQSYIGMMRDTAWARLKRAARAGHGPAIQLVIKLLHEGRYCERDDKRAYFWILRLRHLGVDPGPEAAQIEASLSTADREYARFDEAEERNHPNLPP